MKELGPWPDMGSRQKRATGDRSSLRGSVRSA
jgi:hypothetical protein